MKLKNIKLNKSKLVRLQLLKSKTYIQDSTFFKQKNSSYITLIQTELHLKKALQVVYNYHCNNKKIFFIGVPMKVQSFFNKVIQKSQHLFIPESIWVNGVLSNKSSIFKYINQQIKSKIKTQKSSQNFKSLFKIQQKPDLIVLFNKELELNALKESSKLSIPIIAVSKSLIKDQDVLYKIPGNFHFLNKKFTNVFFLLLNSIFKKSNY